MARQALLVYNANAGKTGVKSPEALQDALRDVGFRPVYKATKSEADLDHILADFSGHIVVAGGDGTQRAVMTRILGRDDVTLTPIPLGTANNIAQVLGLHGDADDLIAGLGDAVERPFDIGKITGPWGEDYFLEGAGAGFFAEVLATYDPDQGKSVMRSLKSIIEAVTEGHSVSAHLTINGEEIKDRFLLLEALNTPAVGPRLNFAPDADPGDGLLNIVLIHEDQRNNYLKYLGGLATRQIGSFEEVTSYRAQSLTITWPGAPIHVDAEVRTLHHVDPVLMQDEAPRIRVELLPGAVKLLLPRKGSD